MAPVLLISSKRRAYRRVRWLDYANISSTRRCAWVSRACRARQDRVHLRVVHGLTRRRTASPYSSRWPRADRARGISRRNRTMPCRASTMRTRPHPIRGAPMAELDRRHQRIAALIDYQRPTAPTHADIGHRRLSRRMAAGPAAAHKATSNGRARASLCRGRRRARISPTMARASCDFERAGREDEQATLTAARLFTDYLRACRTSVSR